MTPRRCSCCSETGHNILRCNDGNAHVVMGRILNSDIDTALTLVDNISDNHVSFVLVRGYHLSVRLNRAALRARVLQDHMRDPTSRPPPTNVRPIQVPSTNASNAGVDGILDILAMHIATSRLVSHYYLTHRQTQARVSIYMLVVSRYLKILEQGARQQSAIEFDQYMNLRLFASIGTYCQSLRDVLSDDEIRHVDNMCRMYNYKRLLQFSNTFDIFWPAVVDKPDTMKVLPIKITICEPCLPEDTCGVCFDELPSEKLVKTGCGHTYCSACIAGVAHQRGIKTFIPCPGCRADIVELKVYNEEEHQLVLDGLKPV